MELQLAYQSHLQRYGTKYEALYHAVRETIVTGLVPYGAKLPSSRELAATYGLSRGTVNQVYDMLAAEGYVTAGVGSGTFAAFLEREAGLEATDLAAIRLSAWGERVALAAQDSGRAFPAAVGGAGAVRFAPGLPDAASFPQREWARCLYAAAREQLRMERAEAFAAQGHLPLREAIAAHLRRTRGMDADAERIVVTGGSMQAIALLAQLLAGADDGVVVEEPGYSGIRAAVAAAGGRLVPAPVDGHGIVVADWQAKLAFVTPGRQYPTGAVLPLERRQALLAWAGQRGAFVVEDDYDSEFRHRGRPVEPLQVLDEEGRVVYIGTFSKTMPPELRIGFVLLPQRLVRPFVAAKRLFEPHPASLLEQRALAAFMSGGMYERHLRRMKRIYGRRFALLGGLLREKLADRFEVVPSDAGLHLFAWWTGTQEAYGPYREACRAAGVEWSDGGSDMAPGHRPFACFGFADLPEERIREGIERMALVR
ncbi:MAG: PLP-dependent aminotransferase family protein [Paenibacillaceae bacterium]|nr:PLP-dependent aminotransferase family protein [Paenibacillaceae bacterium]